VHRELLGAEEAGLVFPVDDSAAAARCLRRILDDDQLARQLGARGKRLAERFRPEPITRALRAVYEAPRSRPESRAREVE
jgi:glycosyltransferase involved in cell wall biosynthesis